MITANNNYYLPKVYHVPDKVLRHMQYYLIQSLQHPCEDALLSPHCADDDTEARTEEAAGSGPRNEMGIGLRF